MNRRLFFPPQLDRWIGMIALLASWLHAVAPAGAQTPLAIGPAVGYSFGVPLTVERAPGTVNQYGDRRPGNSYDHALWFGVDAVAPSLLGERLDLVAELGLALSTGRFTSDPFRFGLVYDSASAGLVSPLRQFDVSSNLSALQLDLQAAGRIGDRWYGRLGLWLQYRLTSNFIQRESLLDYPTITYGDGTRSHLVAGGEALGAAKLRYGPVLSGAFRIALPGDLDLLPHLDLRLDVPALAAGMGFRSFRAGGGGAMMFSALVPPPSDDPPPVIPLSDSPRPHLHATIDLYSIGADSVRSPVAVVRPVDLLHRRAIPFAPLILFDPDSLGIPARYPRLSREEADGFSARSLARMEPAQLQRQLLNVLGMRLRARPAARVWLLHPAGEMMSARALRLRDYLRDVWGIDERRFNLRIDRDGRRVPAGVPYVAVAPVGEGVADPVVAEWMVRELQAPSLGITQNIETEAGLRSWSLTVVQGTSELARYAGRTQKELRAVDLSLRIDGRSAEGVTVTLAVIDSAGDTAIARDMMELVRDDRSKGRKERCRFLMPDDEPDGPTGMAMMGVVLESMRDGASVTIAPAGDAPPDASLERTAELLLVGLRGRGLRAGEIRITRNASPAGGDDVPSERYPASGVMVSIEQERSEP